MAYVLKKVKKITANDIVTKKFRVALGQLKKVQLTGNSDVIWADGTDGAHLVGFDANKVSKLTAENGEIEMGYIELQTGAEQKVITDGTKVKFTEYITVTTADELTISHKATGTVGAEIKYVYPVGVDGVIDTAKALVQAATVAPDKFAYAAATKKITFNVGSAPIGSRFYVEYFPKFSEYKEIANDVDKYSETCEIYLDCWFTDTCTKKDIPMQLYLASGRISGAIDYAFGDAAAVQGIEIEALMNACGDEKSQWVMRTYDTANIVDT